MQTDSLVPSLDHAIGQKRAVAILKTAVEAYWHDRSKLGDDHAFPHTLMVGPAGVGKTFFSELLARTLVCRVHTQLAQNLNSVQLMQGAIMMLEPGDILFVDEIHELSPMVGVTLYRVLEERLLFLNNSRSPLKVPPFCLIGASTHEGTLERSLKERFKLLLRLQHLDAQDIANLLLQRAKRLGWSITESSAKELASRSRGTPRLAIKLLDSAKRIASSQGTDDIEPEHIEEMLELEGIDSYGFDVVEQKYLRILKDHQGPVRLNVLATHLGVPKQTIEMLESDFIRLGLITKGDKGRVLTPAGVEHLNNYPIQQW